MDLDAHRAEAKCITYIGIERNSESRNMIIERQLIREACAVEWNRDVEAKLSRVTFLRGNAERWPEK